jgi:hypothetical protein
MTELNIQLKTPISVAYKGELREVEILTIYPPNLRGYNLYSDIKSLITSSVLDMQNKINTNGEQVNNNDEESNDRMPLELFLATGTINELSDKINKYLFQFAKFDGEIGVNKNNIEKLNIKDYNEILEKVSYFLFQI